MNKLDKAFEFAKEKHKLQKDDSGLSYFNEHLQKVAASVAIFTNNEDVIAAAFLHDTIEDTETTYEELVTEFGKRVADLVNEVTHDGELDSYGRYFPRLHSQEGILIKLCDRASNVSRMQAWSSKRQAHYLKKTKFWKDGSDRPNA